MPLDGITDPHIIAAILAIAMAAVAVLVPIIRNIAEAERRKRRSR